MGQPPLAALAHAQRWAAVVSAALPSTSSHTAPCAPAAAAQVNERQQSADGHELNFATNTLGAFALTLALEPALKRSAPSKASEVGGGGGSSNSRTSRE